MINILYCNLTCKLIGNKKRNETFTFFSPYVDLFQIARYYYSHVKRNHLVHLLVKTMRWCAYVIEVFSLNLFFS